MDLKNKVQEYFSGLEFNSERHSYSYKNRGLTPVSSVIKKYVEYVDFDKIAEYTAKKRGITKAEVLAEWNAKKIAACNQGTSVHSFGEIYKPGMNMLPRNGFEESIVKFWDNIPEYIEPFLFELKMFSEALGIAGTADILLYNTKTGKFIIADYKTNFDLFKSYKDKRLLPPFDHLVDSPFNKYQIQLSLYQLLFEQSGFEVESRRIVWLRPNGTYESYKTEDLTQILMNELTKNR